MRRLLQNASIQLFAVYKMRRLLQNASIQLFAVYKVRRLLQNASIQLFAVGAQMIKAFFKGSKMQADLDTRQMKI